ncbi:MAG TPA: DNA-processing protein DprA [Mycobacteriales bacterium]|jgi:DNA processing protein|nr:DNA-processing protein DprA [Mycobacteriales bacterium]
MTADLALAPGAAAAGASPERRLACAALSRAVAPDDRHFRALYPRYTPEEAWARLVAGDAPPELVAATRRAVAAADPQRDLDAVAALGGRLVCPGDADWPEALDDLRDRVPVALWVRGGAPLAAATERSVAIVGSRAATPYGNLVAAELAVELGERGWAVVSGGAYGIDAAAHRGALAAGAPTVAVLACGVDVSYPSGNRRLFDDVAAAGLLVSEWPPGASPTRLRFLWRNRVIAALARGTVVVEMGHRSGARRTCSEASSLGRHVMAVPGPVTSAVSVGCHTLLRQGVPCVTSAAEVLELVGRLGEDVAPVPPDAATRRDRISRDAQRVLDALDPLEFLTAEQVAAEAQQDQSATEVLLDALCDHDLVVCSAGRYRLGPAALEGVRRSA